MRALLQLVKNASVMVEGHTIGEIGSGLMILLGVQQGDTEQEAHFLARKTAELRIFPDENGKMNLSLLEVGGAALVISQFTLCADCKKGRRPAFVRAEQPTVADALYQRYVQRLRNEGVSCVKTGEFGAFMEVSLCNHGPVTILLDTKEMMLKG
ncbi:MAG: D-aminoacyl-tRNA deacylase [Oscillospiraceae bacterium]